VRIVGLAQGNIRFDLPASAPMLAEALSDLFSVQLRALHVDGRRVIVPDRPPRWTRHAGPTGTRP
jgi:hypothetical protein